MPGADGALALISVPRDGAERAGLEGVYRNPLAAPGWPLK